MGQTKLCWGGLILLSSSCQLLNHPHDRILSSGYKSFSSFNIMCKAVPLIWQLFYFKEAPFILLFIFPLFLSNIFPWKHSWSVIRKQHWLVIESIIGPPLSSGAHFECVMPLSVPHLQEGSFPISHVPRKRENSSFLRSLRQREAG